MGVTALCYSARTSASVSVAFGLQIGMQGYVGHHNNRIRRGRMHRIFSGPSYANKNAKTTTEGEQTRVVYTAGALSRKIGDACTHFAHWPLINVLTPGKLIT